ncbi:MAG: c-type cytochrome [Rhodomicrobiaceae bacterium]
MKSRTALIVAAFLAATAGNAQAADTAQGRDLAQKLCVNCHIIEHGGEQDQVTVGVPTFMAIANEGEQTKSKLRSFMRHPHPPMPSVELSEHQLDNIVAYILSLKDR